MLEDLPIPTARQRIIGRWTPETTDIEKEESVIRAIRARIYSLLDVAKKIASGSDTVQDVISYLAGAKCSSNKADDMATAIILDDQLLDFLLSVEKYLSNTFTMADHTALEHAVNEYRRKSPEFASMDRQQRTDIVENLTFQIKRYLAYLHTFTDPYPLKTVLAKCIKGIDMNDAADSIASDIYAIEGFAVFEQLLLAPAGKPEFVELREMLDLLHELKGAR